MLERKYSIEWLSYPTNPHLSYWDWDSYEPELFWTVSGALSAINKKMKKAINQESSFQKYRIVRVKKDGSRVVLYTITLRAPTKEK